MPVYGDPPDSTVVEYSTAVENLRPDAGEVLAAALVGLGWTKKDAGRRRAIARTRLCAFAGPLTP